MRRGSIKYLFTAIFSVFMMAAWFLLLEYFNGGDHPLADMGLFRGLVASEIITFIVVIYFTVKGRNLNINHSAAPEPPNPTPIGKRFQFDLLIFIPAIALSAGFMLTGSYVLGGAMEYNTYLFIAYIVCALVPIIIFVINAILKKKFLTTLEEQPIDEFQRRILQQRERAEEAAKNNLKDLKRIRVTSVVYTLIYLVCGALTAFLAAAALPATMYGVAGIYAFVLFTAPVSHIIKCLPKRPTLCISKDKYPHLYEMAYKAANTLGVKGQIIIALSSDFNASIIEIGKKHYIVLGVSILNSLSKEELYSVFLHEFGHIQSQLHGSETEDKFYLWLGWQASINSYANFISGIYGYVYMNYEYNYAMYRYASSIFAETEADKSMVKYGDAKAAASALTKLNYHELFTWEHGTYDELPQCESETLDKLYLTREIELFNNAIKRNSEKWNKLLSVEILARNASHPTLKMRLETLGISEISIVEYDFDGSFKDECRAALTEAEEYIYLQRKNSYNQERKNCYTIPKKIIEEWEKEGSLITVENSGKIYSALSSLGRHIEAYQFCEKVINTLPPAACAGAYLMKGSFLLRSYDEKGIECIYKAVELDHEYSYALDLIGVFCCKTGRQKELDEYRTKAIQAFKDEQEIYSKISVLNSDDNLTAERLTKEAFDSIMSFIQSIENNGVECVYFVRKTIKADYFVTCVVVKFKIQTKWEDVKRLMDNLYVHLEGMTDRKYVLFNYYNVQGIDLGYYDESCYYLDQYKGKKTN
ncbi:MAG: M48 family metalloprotease [Clostridiales bacterium]|nr:M48 family metalloprotease [Clostridiales bacterium]